MNKSLHNFSNNLREKLDIRGNDYTVFGICFSISFIYLLFCTKSSPLYPFNDWTDVNAFFTVGKGMMHGLVPYRDLFEQKGPLLYFIYGVASLISYKTFLGGFVIEVFAFTFFLFFSYKSMMLFMEGKYALIALPFLSILILNLKAFTHGGSAEELCLPLLAISLFHLLRFMKSGDVLKINKRVLLWNGFIAGCILWIKFTMLGFWIGWILAVFVNLLILKDKKQAFRDVGIFLGGMLIATLPWIVYFGVNHAITDWINTYLLINLTGYTTTTTFFQRIFTTLLVIFAHFLANPIFGSLLWFGMIVFLIFHKFITSLRNRLFLLNCGLMLILGVYIGSSGYVYYYLILTPLIVLGMIALSDFLQQLIKEPVSIRCSRIVIILIVVVSLPLISFFGQNSYFIHVRQEDLVQYRFGKIINNQKNSTLLNYGVLDMGFYTTTGIIPNIKYFELQNLDYARYPLNLDEQQRYIQEGVTNFVVLRGNPQKGDPTKSVPFLEFNYHLVATGDQVYEGHEFNYYLYERNEY